MEEIALTPEANPLQTPFSAPRPHASHLRPILVRGSPRFGHADAGSTGGSPQDVPLSWSSLEQEGSSSQSRRACCCACRSAAGVHGCMRMSETQPQTAAIPRCCTMAAHRSFGSPWWMCQRMMKVIHGPRLLFCLCGSNLDLEGTIQRGG